MAYFLSKSQVCKDGIGAVFGILREAKRVRQKAFPKLMEKLSLIQKLKTIPCR
jgi:hypothetical protein